MISSELYKQWSMIKENRKMTVRRVPARSELQRNTLTGAACSQAHIAGVPRSQV